MTSHGETPTPSRRPRARTKPARRASRPRRPRANGPARPRERASGSCGTPCSPERNAGIRPISTLVGRCRPSTLIATDSSPRAKRTPTPHSTVGRSAYRPSTRTTAPRCSSRSTPRRSGAGSARASAPRRRAASSPTSRCGTSAPSSTSRPITRSRAHSTRCSPERDPTLSTSSPRSLRRATSPRRSSSR